MYFRASPSPSSWEAGLLQPLLTPGLVCSKLQRESHRLFGGFPIVFWKFCFLLFGTTIRGGTGQDRSLWLWHLPQWLKFYYLKSHHYKLNFIIFFPFSFSFLLRRGHTYPRLASNIVKDNLELQTILPPPPECWDYRCAFTALGYKLNTH